MKNLLFFVIPTAIILGAISCKPKEVGADESLLLSGIGFNLMKYDTGLIYKYRPGSNFKNPIDSVAWYPKFKTGSDTVDFDFDPNKFQIKKEFDYTLVVPIAGNYRITGINVSGSEALHDVTRNIAYYGIVSCIVNNEQYTTKPHDPEGGYSRLFIRK